MTVKDFLSKYPIDTESYVIKKMKIHWNSIRFDNTSIEPAKFIVQPKTVQTFYTSPIMLVNTDTSKFKNYNKCIDANDEEYECFLTSEEAEIWKILELQGLESQVEDHITSIRKKSEKKLKTIKSQEKLDDYIKKYPEIVMKVI